MSKKKQRAADRALLRDAVIQLNQALGETSCDLDAVATMLTTRINGWREGITFHEGEAATAAKAFATVSVQGGGETEPVLRRFVKHDLLAKHQRDFVTELVSVLNHITRVRDVAAKKTIMQCQMPS